MSTNDERDPAYLGDGVYTHHDGYQIWIKVQRGEDTWVGRPSREHWCAIALEPAVFAALVDYERSLRAKYAAPIDEAVADGPGHELE